MTEHTPLPWRAGRLVVNRSNRLRSRHWKAAEAMVEAVTLRGAGKTAPAVARFASPADRDLAAHRIGVHDTLVAALARARTEKLSKAARRAIDRALRAAGQGEKIP
jgi:hypothetical protein